MLHDSQKKTIYYDNAVVKIFDLPVLKNDTNNVIEFNNSLKDDIEENKKRSFWNLLKKE